MKIAKIFYVFCGVILILLIIIITLITLLIRCSHDDYPPLKPTTNSTTTTNSPITSPIIDPDEIPLPFTRALIVKINDSALWARDIDGDSSIFLIKNWPTPFHSFDLYLKKNIYFVNTIVGQPIISYSKRFSQLTQAGTWVVTKIAVDYIHEKLYAIDEWASKVNVFDIQSGYYNIISTGLNQLKDISVDPFLKHLFILQLSSILKTNLDGSSPKIIFERSDILAFEVDVDQERIYLATPHNIQSVDYEGQNVITVNKITRIIISLAVTNNRLFWLNPSSDYEKPTLWSCKIDNICKNPTNAVFDDNAVEVKAYNFDKRQVSDSCKNERSCEHMCIDSNNGPQCVCTIGWQLQNDKQSCEIIDQFLVYVQGDFVKGRVLNFSKDAFTDAFLPFQIKVSLKKKEVIGFNFNTRSHEMFFSDDNSVNKVNLKSDSQQIKITGDFMEKKFNPAVDWITRNVYFIKILSWSDNDIAVQKLDPYDDTTTEKSILHISFQNPPRSLVVHPNRGFLFVTISDPAQKEPAQIVRAHLDGSGRKNFGQNLSITYIENGLAIDYEEDRLFWFDNNMKYVHSADLECSNLATIDASIVEKPTMINIYGTYMYISNLTSVWRINKKTGGDILKILPDSGYESQPIRGAKIFSAKSQVVENNHPCAGNNGGCQRYCFARPKLDTNFIKTNQLERICGCNSDEKLDSDGKSCIIKI